MAPPDSTSPTLSPLRRDRSFTEHEIVRAANFLKGEHLPISVAMERRVCGAFSLGEKVADEVGRMKEVPHPRPLSP
jgi:hypothetical protein